MNVDLRQTTRLVSARSAVLGEPVAKPVAPYWLGLLAAAASGPINAAAFPALGWWPLVFLGTALMMWSVAGRRLGTAFLFGLVGGFGFWGVHIFWLTTYLGPVPWLALAGLQTLFFALGAVLLALAWRVVPAVWPGRGGRLVLLPAVLGAIWAMRESITSNWPYGGFSWGRLAFSQSESPFAHLVAWVGISGLSFLIAWASAVLIQTVRMQELRVPLRGIVAAGVLVTLLLVPAWPYTVTGHFRVAAVQGNSDAGLFAQKMRGDTLNEHISETLPLFGTPVDVLVWPENAADLNPLRYPQAAEALDFITEGMNAPLVTGTITNDDEGRTFNSLLLWEPGKGPVDQYDKIHPVPFAEYIPDRAFWYPFAPSLLDLVPRDYTIGQRDNIFTIGGVRAGLAICFDIVDDGLVRQMIDEGAQVILAPTNNADFGHSDENVQQVAIAQLRGIETARSVVQVSTVGVSAIFAPDGDTMARLPVFTSGSMVESVPLSSTTTPATVLGSTLDWAVSAFALAELALCLLLFPRGSRKAFYG